MFAQIMSYLHAGSPASVGIITVAIMLLFGFALTRITKLLKLPTPKLVVFYNGTADKEDEIILRLSDSFSESVEADIEVKVRMININHG